MGDDEKFDLDDDDLDLGDDSGDLDSADDFAGELDDMIGDDDLGDDLGGGEEGGDSELDSFFEDLSSIEELDSEEQSEEASSPVAQAAAIPAAIPEVASPAQAQPVAQAAEGGKSGKLKYIIIFALLFVLGGGGAGYWFFFMQPEEILLDELEEEPLFPDEMEMPLSIEQESMSPSLPIPAIAPTYVPPVSKKRYLIQIAQCSFEKCKEDFTRAIRSAGEPVFRKKNGEKFDFIEVRSRKVYSYRDSNKYVEHINKNNKMAGVASLVSKSNGYRITMGTFPALDRAKIIKAHIEKLFPGKEVVFHLDHVRKSYETTKIFAGPYNSREEANNRLRDLRLDPQFRGSFLVRYPR